MVLDENGVPTTLVMGSYGIGVSRLVGAIIEACHDDDGIVWPESVAPFRVGLINLKPGDGDCDRVSGDLYDKLRAGGIEVLLDDGEERAGAKFATMDLLGLPWQLIVGPRSAKDGTVERFEADVIVLCTGSRPRIPDWCVPDGHHILTTRDAYPPPEFPEHLVVVGSGVTGVEFVHMFTSFGAQVSLIVSRQQVLPGKDPEVAGVLDRILNRLAAFREKAEEIRSKVVGAMIYPLVVSVVAVAVVSAAITIVIPKFRDIFESFGKIGRAHV